jgi:hypothetical protein
MFKKIKIENDTWVVETPNINLYVVNFYNKQLCAWAAAQREDGSYTDSVWIHDTRNINDFDAFIEECVKVANVCPECGKPVPFKEQRRVAFANRCCRECYPTLKSELERPGWTM